MNDVKGKFYAVFGFSASGKTTLVRYLLEKNNNMSFYRTTTTRKPRPDELEFGSLEYEFVSVEEYKRRMQSTLNWNHNEVFGNYYGSDLSEFNSGLSAGKSFISVLKLDKQKLERLKLTERPYEVVTILINTRPEVARQRLDFERPSHEIKRIEEEAQFNLYEVMHLFDHVFNPTGSIKEDCENFIKLFS